jgi:PPOX class probable F420-dependent enzyme
MLAHFVRGAAKSGKNVVMTTFPDSHKDLLDAQVASLATIGGDGFPQATAIWFLYDEGKIKISLNNSRLKTKNLLKRPKVSLMILDPANPYRYLEVRGTATATPDPDYVFAKKVGAKYGGADLSEHDGPGDTRLEVVLEPTNVYAVAMG